MNVKVLLYIVSGILALVGFPTVLVLVYLDLINSGISSRFLWAASIACCILCILSFSLAHILTAWEEEDGQE